MSKTVDKKIYIVYNVDKRREMKEYGIYEIW